MTAINGLYGWCRRTQKLQGEKRQAQAIYGCRGTSRRGPTRVFRHPAGTLATWLQLAFAITLLPAASAQQESVVADQPQYTVEMIVFSYRASDSAGTEVFVPDRPTLIPDVEEELPADMETGTLEVQDADVPAPAPQATDAQDQAQDGPRPERERIELHLLEPEAYTMDEIWRKLEQLDAYEPLMRTAWTQTTPVKEASPAIQLRALGEPPLGLDGSITLYRGRYVHLVVDLALDADSGGQALSATDRLVAYGDARVRDDSSGQNDDHNDDNGAAYADLHAQPVRYRILEDRIMREGDIRYFDHPRFGVVAKVVRRSDDNDGPAEGATPDSPGGSAD